MADELGSTFVYVICFLGVYALIVAALGGQFVNAVNADGVEYDDTFDPSEWQQYDYLVCGVSASEVWNITSSDITTELWWQADMMGSANLRTSGGTNQNFYNASVGVTTYGDIHVLICRNNTMTGAHLDESDFIYMYQLVEGGWIGADYDYAYMDLERIWNNLYGKDEIEDYAFKLYVHGQAYHVQLALTDNTTTLYDATQNNSGYCIRVTEDLMDQEQTSISAWQVIGMILTLQLPQVHWLVNALVAIPLWACIAYLAYRLILLAIPFVG